MDVVTAAAEGTSTALAFAIIAAVASDEAMITALKDEGFSVENLPDVARRAPSAGCCAVLRALYDFFLSMGVHIFLLQAQRKVDSKHVRPLCDTVGAPQGALGTSCIIGRFRMFKVDFFALSATHSYPQTHGLATAPFLSAAAASL